MFHKIEHHLQEINSKMQTLVATNVAKHLAPFIASANHPLVQAANVQPQTRSQSVDDQPSNEIVPLSMKNGLPPSDTRPQSDESRPVINRPPLSDTTLSVVNNGPPPDTTQLSSDTESPADISMSPNTSGDNQDKDADLSISSTEVQTTPFVYSKELLSSSEITPIYVKSRNRRNFAALLVQKLFDIPTRMRSNVAGRGKEKLDPEIIKYVKAKCFDFYECHPSEVKEEWSKCVISIDEKSRALKKIKSKKETENLSV